MPITPDAVAIKSELALFGNGFFGITRVKRGVTHDLGFASWPGASRALAVHLKSIVENTKLV